MDTVGPMAGAPGPASPADWAPADLAGDGDEAQVGGVAPVDHLGFVVAAERVLDAVDRALARLDDGSYGVCEVCAEPIADGDLEEDPTAAYCSRHLPLARSA